MIYSINTIGFQLSLKQGRNLTKYLNKIDILLPNIAPDLKQLDIKAKYYPGPKLFEIKMSLPLPQKSLHCQSENLDLDNALHQAFDTITQLVITYKSTYFTQNTKHPFQESIRRDASSLNKLDTSESASPM